MMLERYTDAELGEMERFYSIGNSPAAQTTIAEIKQERNKRETDMLMKPPTANEIASLLSVIPEGEMRNILRRLTFQRDTLKTTAALLERAHIAMKEKEKHNDKSE